MKCGPDSSYSKPYDDDEMIVMTLDDNLLTTDDLDEIDTQKQPPNNLKDDDAAVQHSTIAGDFAERPLSNFNIQIDSITPGDIPPRIIMEETAGLKIMLHFVKDRPRDDISVIVITTTNHNSIAIKDYQFDASVSKVCKDLSYRRFSFKKNMFAICIALQTTASTSVRHKSSRDSTVSSASERYNADTVVIKQGPCLTKNYLYS